MPGTSTSGGRRNSGKSRRELEIAGTFRKDRHGDLRSPEPTPGAPNTPEDLTGLAKEEWDRLMWAFEDMGMLCQVDLFAVYQHCRLYAETEAVSEQQAEARAGLRVLEENLSTRPESPEERLSAQDKVALFTQIVTLHKLVSKCTDQLRQGRMAIRQYLVEFGLTPSARHRIKLPAKREEVDEFAAYQQKRGAA